MNKYTKSIRNMGLPMAVAILAGCASSEFAADTARVDAIQTVAVVAFTVPEYVTEEESGGSLAGAMALMSLGKQLAKGEKVEGNGEEVAEAAVRGFVEKMQSSGNMKFQAMNQVTANPEFMALKKKYEAAANVPSMGAPGLPVIVLEQKATRSNFAGEAARALDVDGVIIVYVRKLEYALYTGISGNGQAKAEGSALFKLYDRDGNAVWQSGSVVRSEASAAMVAGAINPKQAPALHKDIGAMIAANVLRIYAKETK